MVNKVILVGSMGKDPELRTAQGGLEVCKASIVTEEKRKDKQSGELKTLTEWHRLVVFGKLAPTFSQVCQKGARVYVEGKLHHGSYEAKEGHTVYTTDVIVSAFQVVRFPKDSTPVVEGRKRAANPPSEGRTNDKDGPPPMDDADLPF